MVSIECPHCEDTFQVNPDNLGKAMRCPQCHEVFVASEKPAPMTSPEVVVAAPEDRPHTSRNVQEYLEVIDLPVEKPVQVKVDRPRPVVDDIPTLSPKLDDDIPTLPPMKPAAKPKPSVGPKEVIWSGDEPPAPTKPSREPAKPLAVPRAQKPDDDEDDLDIEDELLKRRQKRRRSWGKTLFFGLIGAVALTVLVSAVGYWRYTQVSEKQLYDEAKIAFEESNFPLAQKKYEDLAKEYPDSSNVNIYQFFASLAESHNTIGGVMIRENPQPAIEAFTKFTTEHGQSPLAMPESGYGDEIVQLGRKLLDAVADHAGDRMTNFQNNRAKLETLEECDKAISTGLGLVPTVDKFRSKNAVTLDSQKKRFDDLTTTVAKERHRLGVLEPFRNLSDDPTTPRIEEFEKALADNQLSQDAEAKAMLAAAEKRLRELLLPVSLRKPATLPPMDLIPPVLFSSSLGGIGVFNPEAQVDVTFAVARGVLYALDSGSGLQLWGTRIAGPTADLRSVDLPVRVTMGEQDWVLVVGEIAGQPSLTARLARTGEPIWYQPLEAAPAGRPVVSGGRIYLPLRNSTGTVAEFETASGLRTGNLSMRQPIGAGLSLLPTGQPGRNLLVVPADMKRVFLWELGREDADGARIPARCVRVILTEHPRDSLRGEIAVITPADDNGPRYLVLTQTDGPTTMKLRAFALPKPDDIIEAGTKVAQESAEKASEVSVAGWSWFPAVSDGERLVLASDAGAFFALGVNQIGNVDNPLFTLPAPKAPSDQTAVMRSLVVQMEEDAYWVVLNGRLVRLRTAVDPVQGLRILAQGGGPIIGEPLHRAEVRPIQNVGIVVGRMPDSASVQAVGFDLSTGQLRWIRRLGLAPAGPPISLDGNRAMVVDEDGGVSMVNTAPGRKGPSMVASIVALPYPESTGKSGFAASADGKTVWVVTPEVDKAGRRVRLRNIIDGVLKTDKVVPLPDQLAGSPVVMGNAVVMPLVNGYLYRFAPEDAQLMVGPGWRSDGAAGELTCLMSTHGEDEILVTDGSRKFLHWKWPTGAKATKVAGAWEIPGKIALAPVAVPTSAGLMIAVIDSTGTLFLYKAEAAVTDAPVRRYRASEGSVIPPGRPTQRLEVIGTGDSVRIVYCVANRYMVGIDPMKPEPAWATPPLVGEDVGELLGFTRGPKGLLVTDPTGQLQLLNPVTGDPLGSFPSLPGQALPLTPAIGTTTGESLQLTLDGTAGFVPLGK